MRTFNARGFATALKTARLSAGLTQRQLAEAVGVNRVQIVRMEAGQLIPRLDEAIRIATALNCPLEFLWNWNGAAGTDLRGIAIELYHLGIHDLHVAEPQVPGALRHREEVLVLAVSGDRPEPRVVEAIPYVLAQGKRRVSLSLLAGFSDLHDPRARTRIAWLGEIALALSKLSTSPLQIHSPGAIESLISLGVKSVEPDSLGYPTQDNPPPIWRRWNITYAGTLQDFLRRTMEVHSAFQLTRTTTEDFW